jgi:hypothetical protein
MVGVFKAPASLCNVPQGFGGKTSGRLNGNLIPTGVETKCIYQRMWHGIKHKLHEYTYIIELYPLASE